MRAWSKSSEALVRSEAQRLIAEHGDEAVVARREARMARNTCSEIRIGRRLYFEANPTSLNVAGRTS
jgi:hypothetical protein